GGGGSRGSPSRRDAAAGCESEEGEARRQKETGRRSVEKVFDSGLLCSSSNLKNGKEEVVAKDDELSSCDGGQPNSPSRHHKQKQVNGVGTCHQEGKSWWHQICLSSGLKLSLIIILLLWLAVLALIFVNVNFIFAESFFLSS
ncbi:unnamed protein product, partial [Heterosigma akashiwo]